MMKRLLMPFGILLILVSISFIGCGPKPNPADQAARYYNRAHTFLVQNKPQDAIPLYHKAIKNKLNFSQAYHELAVCYQQTGNDEKAINNFEAAIVFNPQDVDAYQAIANIYFVKGDFDNALIYYDRASDVDFLYPRSYNNMGTIWYMRASYDLAKKYFNQAIAVDVTYPRAFYGLGLVAFVQGDTTEAENQFQNAVRVGDMPEAVYMLGQLYYDKSEFLNAKNWLTRYIEKEPSGQWTEKAKSMILICEQRLHENK